MIEVTLSNSHGRTIIYPVDPMFLTENSGSVNPRSSLSFFGPEETGTPLPKQQPSSNREGGLGHVNPSALIGECRVVNYSHVKEYISLGDIEFINVKYKERILVKTPIDRFVYLHSEAADMLASKKITLFGIDAMMRGEYDRLKFLSHRKFKGRDITVIEGLDLRDTPPGRYFLIGFPKEPVYGNGVPARVYLIPL